MRQIHGSTINIFFNRCAFYLIFKVYLQDFYLAATQKADLAIFPSLASTQAAKNLRNVILPQLFQQCRRCWLLLEGTKEA